MSKSRKIIPSQLWVGNGIFTIGTEFANATAGMVVKHGTLFSGIIRDSEDEIWKFVKDYSGPLTYETGMQLTNFTGQLSSVWVGDIKATNANCSGNVLISGEGFTFKSGETRHRIEAPLAHFKDVEAANITAGNLTISGIVSMPSSAGYSASQGLLHYVDNANLNLSSISAISGLSSIVVDNTYNTTINLPPIENTVASTYTLRILKLSSSAYTVSIVAAANSTIQGDAQLDPLFSQYDSVTLQSFSNGSTGTWFVI
jgi:hypothetical protein